MDVQAEQSRKLPLITAMSLVIANMIGTGVFTSLGFQTVDIQSGFALLSLWFIGGIFALCGALCYGELGAAMPRSGGEYHYLSEIYHPAIGFLSGWISVTVGFAAPIALAAMAFGAYLSSIFPFLNPLLVAVAVVIFVSLVHLQNVALGNSFQQVSTLIKVLLIAVLIVCGFLLATPQDISFAPSAEAIPLIFSSPFAVSFVYVTYSYSGWNASVYLASELKEPEKNVPRSLFLGTLVVMGFYLLLNFIFLYTTPIDQLAGQLEVGYIAANQIFGSSGGKLMAALIAIGLISSISSMVLAGPRVTEAIGEDIPFFRVLSHKNANGVPHYAILIQLSIVLVFLITSTFEAVTTYLGFTLTLSSFLTVLGLFVHRYKYPTAHRPYRTWGYPITPLIFLGLSVWILVFIFKSNPVESLMGLTTIAFGMPFYWFASQKKLI